MKIRAIFKNQLSQMSRSDQQLTYLLKLKTGYTEVRCILHWEIQRLIETHQYVSGDRPNGVLPLFREK